MLNKNLLIILLFFFTSGCAIKNRFVKRDLTNLATFGISKFFNHNDYEFCKKIDPNFIKPYKNKVNPSKICINYQYYDCHIRYYCKGDKQCQKDAGNYWLPNWVNAKGNLEDKARISKEVCIVERNRCNNSNKKGDITCRR